MDDPVAAAPGLIRHCRLQLHPATLARLMDWQTQAVEGGRLMKPTYSQIVDALVNRSTHFHIDELVPAAELLSKGR